MSATQTADAQNPARISTPVDRYLLASLYLMVMTGFGTLAATGQLDLASVLFVTAALLWRGYLLLLRRSYVLPESWNTRLALGFVLFYLVDVLLVSRSFLTATVHLVMFGLVVKMFSPLRDRDYVLLSALSFAMVLAASVLTVDSAFFLAFCAFLLMAVATFILLQMHRAGTQATAIYSEEQLLKLERRIGSSLSVVTPAILFSILAGAAGIFFILPRVAGGYAGSYSSGSDLSTGFSNEVRLGSIGEIQQSQAVIMHVAVESGAAPGEFKWRGVALSSFDGTTWSNPHSNTIAPRLPDGRFVVTSSPRSIHGNLLRYRVLLEPLSSNVFFLAEQPVTVSGHYSLVSFDAGGGVFDLDRAHPIALYEGESNPARPTPVELRGAEGAYRTDLLQTYLQLPEIDPRILQLAHAVTDAASNPYDKAVALEGHLRDHYGYTLQLPATAPKDPVANFLFERKRGHCEYFASAMAVMLRSIGIPSRVVNGFRGGEFNDLSGKYVIRARDAHSWVEAYFPNYGWVSFDPTPAASLPTHSGGWNRIALYLDAMTSFWREWVVNYDFARQKSLGEEGARRSRALLETLKARVMKPYQRLLASARRGGDHVNGFPAHGLRGLAGLAFFLLLVANGNRVFGWFRLLRRRKAAKAPQEAAAISYERMTASLAKLGWSKKPEQTAAEFAQAIPDTRIRETVDSFTLHYERARFAASQEDADRLPQLLEEINAESR